MARVCWVSCLMGTWWAAAPESLWGSQGCSHSTAMTCLLLSCFQLPQLARQVPCPCKLPSFCCMSKISTANVTFNTSRGAWKCCSNYQDEMQPNHSILGVRVFQSPHSRCGQMWWLITCTSQASAGNRPEGIQPAQLPGTTSHLKVLHLFFQPSYSFLFPLYNWGETQTWKQGTATCSSPPKNKLFSIQDGCKKRHHTPRTAWERPLGWS